MLSSWQLAAACGRQIRDLESRNAWQRETCRIGCLLLALNGSFVAIRTPKVWSRDVRFRVAVKMLRGGKSAISWQLGPGRCCLYYDRRQGIRSKPISLFW